MSKTSIIVVACADRGARNNPEVLLVAFHAKALHLLMHFVKLLKTWLIETKDYHGWK